MPDPIITNNTTRTLVVASPKFEDDILVDAAGGDYVAGTLLGRLTGTGNLTAYVAGAVDGSEIPIAILTCDLTLAAATPVSVRALISGEVRRNDISRYNAGTPTALTQAEVDLLRDFTIIASKSVQLAELDNQ